MVNIRLWFYPVYRRETHRIFLATKTMLPLLAFTRDEKSVRFHYMQTFKMFHAIVTVALLKQRRQIEFWQTFPHSFSTCGTYHTTFTEFFLRVIFCRFFFYRV